MKRMIVRRVRAKRPGVPVTKSQQSGIKLLNNEIVKKFNPAMLDLGDIDSPSQEIEAIAAVFDLSGFTRFCNQVDAYLAIPKFLNDFLNWFFNWNWYLNYYFVCAKKANSNYQDQAYECNYYAFFIYLVFHSFF